MKYSVILVFLISIALLITCVVSEESSSNNNPNPNPEPQTEPDPFYIRPENIREVEVTHEMVTIAWDDVYKRKSKDQHSNNYPF